MYEKYYSFKKKIISDGLLELKRKGKSVAVWSAGNRGEVFLKIYDPEKKYIDYVFDMNQDLNGQCMETGHPIADYKSTVVDLVIFLDPVYEIDSVVRLKKSGSKARICCLDDVLFGDVSFEDSFDMYTGTISLPAVRKAKIASLTIMYNMEPEKVFRNIMTYANQVDRVYIFDNSPISHQDFFEGRDLSAHIRYIHGEGKNYGIGIPINRVAEEIHREGFEWLITFDQDSRAFPNTIHEMRRYVDSSFYDEKVGLVAPNIWGHLEHQTRQNMLITPYLTYKHEVIQSGAMHRLDILKQIGGYNEDLFIDFVDFEYSFRVRKAGYSIIYLNRVYLDHQTEDEYEGFFCKSAGFILKGKVSLTRYYYHFRNFYYCAINFGYQDAIFAEVCKDAKERIIRKMRFDFSEETINRVLAIAERDAEEGRMGEALYTSWNI